MRAARRIVPLLIIVACAGCLTQGEFRPTRFYTLTLQAREDANPAPLPVNVSLRRFTASARYGQRMVRRKSAVEVTYDEYHRWSEAPDELVSQTLCRALEQRGLFRTLIGPDIDIVTDVAIEGRLLSFEQNPEDNAVCSLAVILRRNSDGKVLWAGTPTARTPVKGKSRSDLARAMSRSLEQVADQCAEAWRKIEALQKPAAP